MRVFGIVLAAGAGQRMGGPKADLVLDGTTLLAQHVARLREVSAAHVVAVVRAPQAVDAELVVGATAHPGASLARAVAALERFAAHAGDAVIVTPVDLRPPSVTTLRTLVAALGVADAATPRYAGRSGHPAVVRRAVLAPYRTSAPRLRDVLAAVRRLRVDVEDPSVLGDFDTPADLRAS